MGAIQVKHVSEEVHSAIRQRAHSLGISVGDYLIKLIKRDLATPTRRSWFDQLHQRPSEEGIDAAKHLHTVRAERQ